MGMAAMEHEIRLQIYRAAPKLGNRESKSNCFMSVFSSFGRSPASFPVRRNRCTTLKKEVRVLLQATQAISAEMLLKMDYEY